ncbi:MAG: tetratricopeptide repeat protein, partial [Acidobacteria bacterium]|nr:tetratricopeptide repeat protein [Acidobacteriota bacterium]
EAAGDVEPAIEALDSFVAAVPTCVPALERLIELCRHGFNEDQAYRARVRLADAYLASGRWGDARALAEQLMATRPDDAEHGRRLLAALTGLGVPNPDAVVKAHERRVSGVADVSAFATLPVLLPPPAGDGAVFDEIAPSTAPAPPRASAVERLVDFRSPAPPDQPLSFDIDAALGAMLGRDGASPGMEQAPDILELDLSKDLDELLSAASAMPAQPVSGLPASAAPGDGPDLEGFFEGLRSDAGRGGQEADAARAYDRASVHVNRGETDAAMASLGEAARDPSYRFRAASMLGRLLRERGQLSEAVEWLERAAETPAPNLQASCGLLYELGDTLEAAGEDTRALAVFLELGSVAAGFRDVAFRIRALSPHTGGSGPAKGPA